MKNLLKMAAELLAILVILYLGAVHLMHASSLDGYLQGCKDTILSAAQQDGLQLPDDVVNNYCQDLAKKYVVKK